MIYADGFSNNKESGYTICDEDGKVLAREVFPNRRTANEMELRGIYHSAHIAKRKEVIITDSKVARIWVLHGYANARSDLTHVCGQAKCWIEDKGLTLRWLPREQNLAGKINEGKYKTK